MAHGVLDDRLENERRHETLERSVRRTDVCVPSVATAHFLDREVFADELEFLGERDLEARRRAVNFVKQTSEVVEHCVRIVASPRPPQLTDRVQRVEQEMRTNLR